MLCDTDIFRLKDHSIVMKCKINIHVNHLKNIEYYKSAIFSEDGYLITGTASYSKLLVYKYDEALNSFNFKKQNFLVNARSGADGVPIYILRDHNYAS
jgi:hypothetical protein